MLRTLRVHLGGQGTTVVLRRSAPAAFAAALGVAVTVALVASDRVHLEVGAIIALPAAAALLVVAWQHPTWPVYLGLLVTSADRIFVTDVGGLTLRASHFCFAASLLALLLQRVLHRGHHAPLSLPPPRMIVTVGALLGLYCLAAVASAHPSEGIKQVIVIAGAAVVPAFAIVGACDDPGRVRCALAWFVVAQVGVAGYGLYQFVAGYGSLPQGLSYGGTLNGLHRISALSYEPAFYGAYVLTATPLLIGDFLARRLRIGLPAAFVAAVVLLAGVLANTRATYVALGLMVSAAWLVGYRGVGARRLLQRRSLVLVLPAVVALATATTLTGVNPLGFATRTLRSLTETQNGSEGGGSNSYRLRLYRAAWETFLQHPLLGVGPRNLGYVVVDSEGERLRVIDLEQFGGPPQRAVANNNVLQAAVDAGTLAVAAFLVLVWQVAALAWRGRQTEARLLALGALVVLVVNGMFVSTLWDLKVWTVLALAVAIERARALPAAESPERPATTL